MTTPSRRSAHQISLEVTCRLVGSHDLSVLKFEWDIVMLKA
jgi:hypothetical protein